MADIKKLLGNLLGDQTASEVRKALDDGQKALDAAGVQRKASDGGDNAPADTATGEAVLEAVDAAGATVTAATVKSITDALDSAGALKPAQDAAGGPEALIALLLKAVAQPTPVEEPGGGMADGAMAGEMMKSLTEYIVTSTKDMGDLARAQADLANAYKAVSEENKALHTDVENLKKLLGDKPRQASKAAETVVEGEEAEKAIQKSLGDTTTIAGIRVRKDHAPAKA